MKRNLPETEYHAIAQQNQDALDYPEVCKKQKILKKYGFWLVVENIYPYVSYIDREVIEHWLIIPCHNYTFRFRDISSLDTEDIQNCISFLNDRLDGNINVVMWKESGKSIPKFHIHYISLKNENGQPRKPKKRRLVFKRG